MTNQDSAYAAGLGAKPTDEERHVERYDIIDGEPIHREQPAPVEAVAAVPAEGRETGWLIESGAGTYWSGRTSTQFTSDVNEACRFARLHDAERVRCWLIAEDNKALSAAVRATEHVWLAAAPPPASQIGEER